LVKGRWTARQLPAMIALMAAALLIPLALGLVLYLVIHAGVRVPGQTLQHKFQALGTLKGLSEAQIIAAVGAPRSRSAMQGGYLLQWMATGYHIALIFDTQGICGGVSHEHSA
jgi:hypothetical protein